MKCRLLLFKYNIIFLNYSTTRKPYNSSISYPYPSSLTITTKQCLLFIMSGCGGKVDLTWSSARDANYLL